MSSWTQLMGDASEGVGKPRMLIVDDQPVNIQALYRVFGEQFQVFMATSGEQALKVVQTEHPDIILLDVVMPGLDGVAVCGRLKAQEDTASIPVLFVTAQQDEEDETRALEAGGVDFITKPINPSVVRARVRTHLLLKRQSDLLRQMAFVDGLTLIYNRRYFDEQLRTEWARAARSGTPLGLLLLDIDHFKQFNDRYGHQAGDEGLKQVAHALRRAVCRPGDVVARYGGEEFACILPNTDEQGVAEVGRRLIDAVRGLNIAHESPGALAGVVTVSVGGVVWSTGYASSHSMEAFVSLADRRLYLAKNRGRNQLCMDDAV